jgi:hypothetical protein
VERDRDTADTVEGLYDELSDDDDSQSDAETREEWYEELEA